jgi:RNA polymerase sigma factor (sigma-70 family)
MMMMDVKELIVAESGKDFLNLSAKKFTKDKQSAEDLVQDTLLLALKNSQGYVQHTNIRGWLFTIMRNCFINKYRYDQRRKEINQDQGNGHLYDRSSHTGSNEGMVAINTKEIYALLKELPRVFAQPLLLRAEGYKYKEIAWLMNESEGTIKSRIHFTRKMLKEKMMAFV